MTLRRFSVLTSTALLAACTSFEGTYSPSCIAYAGDRIVLENGGFTWDRFTDAIPVDDEGNPTDPTPGYPVHGSYSVQDGTLSLRSDGGESLDSMYFRRQNGEVYMLTGDQIDHLDSTGDIPVCALVLGGADDGS